MDLAVGQVVWCAWVGLGSDGTARPWVRRLTVIATHGEQAVFANASGGVVTICDGLGETIRGTESGAWFAVHAKLLKFRANLNDCIMESHAKARALLEREAVPS